MLFLVTSVLLVTGAFAQTHLILPKSVEGCTNDCKPITDTSLACPKVGHNDTCQGEYLRMDDAMAPNCQVNYCYAGTLSYRGGYSDTVVCKNGSWYGKHINLGPSPKVTCSLRGCNGCYAVKESEECPPKRECNMSMLERHTLNETGCMIFTCGEGDLYGQLDGEWIRAPYLDCHHNMWWRLGSVRTVEWGRNFSVACAKPRAFPQAALSSLLQDDDLMITILESRQAIEALKGRRPIDSVAELLPLQKRLCPGP